MKNRINGLTLLFSILFLLIFKGYFVESLNFAESFAFFSTILAISYQKYINFRKKDDIHEEYERRLKNIESKLGAFEVSKRMSNR